MALTLMDVGIIIAFLIVSLFLRDFLPSYFREKGKNLATQDDIAKITEKIEEVKIQYTTSVEKIKAELQLMISSQAKLQDRSIDSLVEFYENCCVFLFEKLDADIYGLQIHSENPLEEARKFMKSVHLLTAKTFSSALRVQIYFAKEKELISSVQNLIITILKYRDTFQKLFELIEQALIQVLQIDPTGKSEEANNIYLKTKPRIDEIALELKPVKKELTKDFSKLSIALTGYYKKLGVDTDLDSIQIKGIRS